MPSQFPEGDRSIRKIPISTGHHPALAHYEPAADMTVTKRPKKKNKASLFFWALLAVLACAIAGLLLSTMFEKAQVTLVLKSQSIDLPAHIIASEDMRSSGLLYSWVLVKSIPEGFIPIQGSLTNGKIAVLDPATLATVLAAQTILGYRGERVLLSDPMAITASVATSAPTFGHMLVGLTTSASSTVLEWQTDTSAVQKALLGTKRSGFASVIKTFGEGIVEAHLTMRPFWKISLPTDEDKLIVTSSTQPYATQ